VGLALYQNGLVQVTSGPGLDEVDVAIDAVVDAAPVRRCPISRTRRSMRLTPSSPIMVWGDLLVFRHRSLRPRRTGWQPMN
jgi:hypothetical protein